MALVATGHAIALVLTGALRTGVTTLPLVDPPTRGIYAITPRRGLLPSAAPLLVELAAAFASVRPPHSPHQPTEKDARAAALTFQADFLPCSRKGRL